MQIPERGRVSMATTGELGANGAVTRRARLRDNTDSAELLSADWPPAEDPPGGAVGR